MFNTLEEIYVQSIEVGPAYTEQQLVDRALDQIKQTGLYMTACIEWRAIDEMLRDWPTFKDHFTEAYETRLDSGPTAGTAGFHGAANVIDGNDDSLGSIVGSISQMQLANNANAQAMSDGLSTITASTNELRQALMTTQQQLAALAQAVPAMNAAQGIQGLVMPPAQYAAATTAPQ